MPKGGPRALHYLQVDMQHGMKDCMRKRAYLRVVAAVAGSQEESEQREPTLTPNLHQATAHVAKQWVDELPVLVAEPLNCAALQRQCSHSSMARSVRARAAAGALAAWPKQAGRLMLLQAPGGHHAAVGRTRRNLASFTAHALVGTCAATTSDKSSL